MDPIQAELREFIRRLRLDEDRVNLLGRRATALHDGIRDLATDGLGGGGMCITTVQGKVVGAETPIPSMVGLPGATVRLVGSVTSIDYGTYTTDASGLWSAQIAGIAQTTESGILHAYVNGPGVRFAERGPWDLSYSACFTNVGLPAFAPAAATGYHYHRDFSYPLADALELVDPVFSNRTLNWAVNSGGHPASPGAPLWWSNFVNTMTIAGTPCPSASTPLMYAFRAAQALTPEWHYNAVSNAPPVCPNTAGPTRASITIPGGTRTGTPPGVTDKMDFTWTYASTSPPGTWLYGNTAGTIRVYEP